MRYSVTCGRGGGGGASKTWCLRSSKTGASTREPPQPWHARGSWVNVSSGSSTSLSVSPGAPSCLPRRRPEEVREDRLGAGLLKGGSVEGGFEELVEFLSRCRASASTCSARPLF